MRLLSQLRALSCCVLIYAASLGAQDAKARGAETGYPEHAYLSASRYVNAYFGFSFDLPPDAHLHSQADPAARDASMPLLHLTGPAPADAEIVISAIPTAVGKIEDAKLLLRQALDQELYRGVEELHGLTKASFGGHEFYYYETRRGIEQHMLLATTSGEYVLRFFVAAHDEKTIKRLETSVEHLAFFAPGAQQQYVDGDAKPYDGPSISSHRLAQLESDPPAKHIDGGNISGDFYENSMLGFSYRIPQGWSIEDHGAVQPAVEESRLKEDFGRPHMGRVERRLVDACSRTLFSAWAKRPGPGGQVSYDDFGEVTVSAMALSCFPNMKFPEDANDRDRDAFKAFLSEYALTHPIVEDMRNGKVFTQDGITFLFLQGTVAFGVQGDALSRRLSLGVAITQRRGYLLTWFFAAPHEEELRALTNERASFDRGGAVTATNAPQPGGGVAAENEASASPASAAAVAQPETANATADKPSTTTPTAKQAEPSSATSASSETPTASSRPSLLRPGESMESQQGKGAPIKKP
jgi:hypothetical protein